MVNPEGTIDWLGLTGVQREAALALGEDVLLRAGAGTGKTRTLVGRYLALLERGASPQAIAAITFTEKAAREMRNRIRQAIQARAADVDPVQERRLLDLVGEMDSARIGTIHGLCAEIIRAHPAEAAVDPEFEVLDEAAAAIARRQAADQAIVEAANDVDLAAVFRAFRPWGLRRTLVSMLESRLEVVGSIAEAGASGEPLYALLEPLAAFAASPQARMPIETLRALQTEGYFDGQATESMVDMADGLLDAWLSFEQALAGGFVLQACRHLFQARRVVKRGVGRVDGPARTAVEDWIRGYDRSVGPWLGGSAKKDEPPDAAREAEWQAISRHALRVFERALDLYMAFLHERPAMDFDGLESGALELLGEAGVATTWLAKIDHVLVDEFQDTNARQREIIERLVADRRGKLFVVGDAQQSIYRFRGADVTVFRRLGEEIAVRGRELVLDRTFRQHPGLLKVLDQLLRPIFDDQGEGREYQIPYQPLQSARDGPAEAVEEPFVEFVLGLGEKAESARPVAAAALARRLLEMHQVGEIRAWDDVALLLRASTGFSYYEDAFEASGIPYVTVAGRGFYDRPEVREILNLLRALAEPWNEAAMVGLLRSAAVGMTDSGIVELRRGPDGVRPLADAVRHVELGDPEDEAARVRARTMLDDLKPLVDRLPVAQLLKRVVDWADLRAMLATVGERSWANLDKLLSDARDSDLSRVREFLEYLDVIKDVGVREGEAPVDPEGAVRLMTIHKAKGLEFPTVVLADAGYSGRHRGAEFYTVSGTPPAVLPDRIDGRGLLYRWAKADDDRREAAEEARLLYVALTRAKERVLISGHLTIRRGSPSALGWLGGLLERAGIDVSDLESAGSWHGPTDGDRFSVRIAAEVGAVEPVVPTSETGWPPDHGQPLFSPVDANRAEDTDEDMDEDSVRQWRATGRRHPPAPVVGVLVHRAIERWLFPPDERLDRLLRTGAIAEGLVEPDQQTEAVEAARQLLVRLRDDPIRLEIDSSPARYHEVPYTYQVAGRPPDSGKFDLLYRLDDRWRLLDFKTDHLRDQQALSAAIELHQGQMARYGRAARQLISDPADVALVFLDVAGEVRLVPVSD